MLLSDADTSLGEITQPPLLLFCGMTLLGERNAQHLETPTEDGKTPHPDSNYNQNKANLLAEGRKDFTFPPLPFLFKKRGT